MRSVAVRADDRQPGHDKRHIDIITDRGARSVPRDDANTSGRGGGDSRDN